MYNYRNVQLCCILYLIQAVKLPCEKAVDDTISIFRAKEM